MILQAKMHILSGILLQTVIGVDADRVRTNAVGADQVRAVGANRVGARRRHLLQFVERVNINVLKR